MFSFCSFRVTSSYILLLKSHTVAIMSQLNVFKYANIIVYCITYSIKTICYIYEYMNMCKSGSYSHMRILEYGVGHGPWWGAQYVYMSNDRDGVFYFGQIVAVMLKYTC